MTLDEYLDAAPEPHATTLRALRAMLRSIVPDGDEGMSYGMPAMLVGGRAVAGYAHTKHHCSYYPHSGQVLDHVDAELLGDRERSKGTLRFPVDEPLPEPLVRRLVELKRELLDRSS